MKRLNLSQGSAEWLAWRREGLGGSDIAAILGISPYEDATREAVFNAKVHGIERPQNGAMYRGTVLEPHARAAYMDRCRCNAPPVCVERPDLPWARVSLDGLCGNGARIPSQLEEWILELKCPGWETHDLALNGIVPEHFEVQCQWQMFVCGLARCDFASFNPGKRFTPGNALRWNKWSNKPVNDRPPRPAEWLAVVPVPPDPDRQQWILEAAAKFWFEVTAARAAFDREARRA
ncbi:YqaJ-like viral recombinase domain protein [Gemmata obscuriglobus]|uniref:YqaJ viral recombinase domain-containing protein n=1 Tax=Gemmata obscuriglobus TaxID=114 RepID=A0A2Z3GXR4_9BACT|nr:YqaJ viral recombinase family protein [Gemmata obscuriglobus]AWM38188.1 hypothetical protein C1280_15145 [Gemmata obscuriglobus]QEG28911.1 YqaJ-like viral recombinase domain protein [Gemmata obscuriglobus]